LSGSYKYTRTGALGWVYEKLEKNPKWESSDKSSLAKTNILPFVRVPLNILNEKLNWTPIGIVRAMNKNGSILSSSHPRTSPIPSFGDSETRKMMLAKGIMGTIATAVFIAMNNSDDDDDDFYITSFLSKDTQTKNQAMNEGVKPNSVKIGNTFFNYAYFGQSMPFFLAGLSRDLRMYNQNIDDKEFMTYVSFYGGSIAHDFFLQTPFVAANDLMNIAGNGGKDEMVNYLVKFGTRILGNATFGTNLLLSINRTIDDRLYTTADMQSAIMRSFPVSMSFAKPRLNTLGEEIHLGHVGALGYNVTKDDTHKVYKIMTENGYTLRTPNWNIVIEMNNQEVKYKDLPLEQKDRFMVLRGREIKRRVLEDFNELSKLSKEDFDEAMDGIVKDATNNAKKNF
jgi:hypothetical protein